MQSVERLQLRRALRGRWPAIEEPKWKQIYSHGGASAIEWEPFKGKTMV
nr:MAG TPA: hypothetical protein [Caudoviricetes sp.]